MKPFFTSVGQRVLEAFARKRALLALDFDGTLAPIVEDPDRAVAPDETIEVLKQLGKYMDVAVISGRSCRDLRKRLGFRPKFLVGNHGIEGLKPFANRAKAARRMVAAWRQQLRGKWTELSDAPAVWLEDKTYSLSLHYRASPQPKRARRQLKNLIRDLRPVPRIVPGKFLLNVTPEDMPHKGVALLALMAGTGAEAALFIGDDTTDEDVFRLRDRRLITIRVGAQRDSKAKFVVQRQTDVLRVLKRLRDILSHS
ncbi:MAG: trehalose-phosphatase [Bdellovibrionales bacterium]